MEQAIGDLKQEMQEVLTENILSYWMRRMIDEEYGGFYGRVTGMDELTPEAVKGAILNARILWTFSAAYRLLDKEEYLTIARRAKSVIIDYFYDQEYEGVYWALDFKNQPLDTKKQIYAIAFAIYGLSEFNRATGDPEALAYAIRLFECIEDHSFDHINNGYWEAFTREWSEIDDMRLSEKDVNEKKTMNTHLHILESYTNLYRIWKDDRLRKQLRNLIEVFIKKILDHSSWHLKLFFDEYWNCNHHIISYGHDIEASWLIHEAALELGDMGFLAEVESVVKKIANAAFDGFTVQGMIYEKNLDLNLVDKDRHWWVQAETVVGCFNIYQYFGESVALQKAYDCWDFIKNYLIDWKNGEWYWSIRHDGSVNKREDKAGFWKCPYHNGRMCLEVIERIKAFQSIPPYTPHNKVS